MSDSKIVKYFPGVRETPDPLDVAMFSVCMCASHISYESVDKYSCIKNNAASGCGIPFSMFYIIFVAMCTL